MVLFRVLNGELLQLHVKHVQEYGVYLLRLARKLGNYSPEISAYTVSLTLRVLMSYIYMEHLLLMFLDHTQRRSTVGRTPLDE